MVSLNTAKIFPKYMLFIIAYLDNSLSSININSSINSSIRSLYLRNLIFKRAYIKISKPFIHSNTSKLWMDNYFNISKQSFAFELESTLTLSLKKFLICETNEKPNIRGKFA